jgi:hypothetical protein
LPAAGWQRQRRWLVLGALGVVLLAVLVVVLLESQPPSARTLDTYCSALTTANRGQNTALANGF